MVSFQSVSQPVSVYSCNAQKVVIFKTNNIELIKRENSEFLININMNSINEDIPGNPHYANNKIGQIQEGLSFLIRGEILPNGDRFHVDFCVDNASSDIALRLAAVISRNIIGRNTRVTGYWGTEETTSVMPINLKQGSRFFLQILFTMDTVMIAMDGSHVAKYQHRVPYHDIRSIEIRGDVRDLQVDHKIVTDYPQRIGNSKHYAHISNRHAETGIYYPEDYDHPSEEEEENNQTVDERPLPLPYYASFPRGFFELGYSMVIWGRVRSKPQHFRICLQTGHNIWPQPTVALAIEFQFSFNSNGETEEPLIVRNSFTNGRWSEEIKSELTTGLRQNSEFHLYIVHGKKAFEILLNNRPLLNYPYKVNPKCVDTVLVSGDIKLYDIEIEEGD
ncbi:galectin-8-like [Musca autumnalis]|uniref:galectin-8-like n=1 Tax=Musca autumnalis TaxID=221902 RepID=UPI003CE8C3D8